MQVKLSPTYTDEEILRILLDSEGRVIGGGSHGGHAIGRHEVIRPGTGGTSIYLSQLRGRFLGPGHPPSSSGAFQNCLVRAVRFTFNSARGQKALRHYAPAPIRSAAMKVAIVEGGFRMLGYKRSEGVLDAAGANYLPGPADRLSFWQPTTGVAEGIFILLLKAPGDHIHVQTAYPILSFQELSSVKLRQTPPNPDITLPL